MQGLGKTLCAIAAHALEHHALPEHPELHTEHSEQDLDKEVENVLIGKRWPNNPEKEKLKAGVLYTGFTQLEALDWPVMPDGSVRNRNFANAKVWD